MQHQQEVAQEVLSPMGSAVVESLDLVFDDLADEEPVETTKRVFTQHIESRPITIEEEDKAHSTVEADDDNPQDETECPESQYNFTRQEPTQEEEAELRRTVQALFELEESLLNQHMSNIQENAEMLTQEGKLLQTVQAGGLSEDEMDEYAIQLAEYLDRKEVLIYKLQSKLGEFQNQLVKEQQLAQRVTKLTQY